LTSISPVPEATAIPTEETEIVDSPISGKVIPLSEVNDEVFSQSLIGIGNAIIPVEGRVIAPFDGEITVFFDSKHALGLISESGIELLIHVGIDTVNLEGKYFKSDFKQGDHFKKGDILLQFDIDKIKEAGYEITTPVVVTNIHSYSSVISSPEGSIKEGQPLLELDLK
jgi:glucose-specific phosphotransferase system IIA component